MAGILRKSRGLCFSELSPEVRSEFDKLTSRIVIPTGGSSPRSILFTSYRHGEGTSTVVAHVAASLAQGRKNKVLVVDANTRSPGLDGMAQVEDSGGRLAFSDVLGPKVEKWILPKPSPDSDIAIVPSGQATYHPSQVLDHTQLKRFIQAVSKLYDFVIFDSSPIGKYYDSVVLGSHVDGVILVTEAERTQGHELNRAKQVLQDAGIPIVGVILNRRKFRIPNPIFERFLA